MACAPAKPTGAFFMESLTDNGRRFTIQIPECNGQASRNGERHEFRGVERLLRGRQGDGDLGLKTGNDVTKRLRVMISQAFLLCMNVLI